MTPSYDEENARVDSASSTLTRGSTGNHSHTHSFSDSSVNGRGPQIEPNHAMNDSKSNVAYRPRFRVSEALKRTFAPEDDFFHPLANVKTTREQIVDFDGPDDPFRPMNWSFRKKAVTTLLYGFTTAGATLASSIYNPAVPAINSEFHTSEVVSTLGTALLLFGFGFGPLIFSPLSELYGRKWVVLIPYFLAAIFSFATAVAKDTETIMITRFFCGLFGSATVGNTGGVLSDIWPPQQRGTAIVGYAMAVVGGPLVGPIIGGAIVQSYLGWRWTEYITGIFMMAILVVDIVVISESYAPALLVYKARRLRHKTGNWALHAEHEEWDFSLRQVMNKYLVRPFKLLLTPICFFVALYASFVYGILYLNLAAIPIAFEEERGWNPLVGELPFLALLIGLCVGAALNVGNQIFYMKALKANNGKPVPEARLPPMMIGSLFFAAGMFIFGWTSDRDIFWFGEMSGLACMGLGFFTIFQAALNYLVDTFQSYSASAVAANTFLRCTFAGVFPLFANPMYRSLGVPWASSLLGFVAVALIPIPYLFYRYGERIRAKDGQSK